MGAAALAVAEVVEDGGNGGRRWAGVVWGCQDVSLLSLSPFLLYFCHASMMSWG